MLYKIKQIVNTNEKIEFYNQIFEWNVKKLNYFLLLFLFMWWETASKKCKLEKKDISKNEITSQVYPFGNLHMKYVFKAMLNKFRNLFFNKFNFFFN